MPITGQETALATALASAIKAAIEAQSGQPTQSPQYISGLSEGIANALIPFLVANVQVNMTTVEPGSFTSPSGSVTGMGETDPGTIS